MSFHLQAALARPFPIAVTGGLGATTSVDILDPAGAGPVNVPLTDTDSTGVYVGTFTPDQPGTWTLTIDSDDASIDGLDVDVEVARRAALAGCGCGGEALANCCTESGLRVDWPCPNVNGLKCIAAFSVDQVRRWAQAATELLFVDTCRRWPGCNNFAKLRPVVGGWCLAPLPPKYGQHLGLDLWDSLRYPALELCAVEVDGATMAVDDWRIEGKRWLVPEGSTAWPDQDLHQPDGAAGTWSATIRYGKAPSPLAVAARDQLMLQMLLGNEVPAFGEVCTLDSGLVQLNENGRSMVFDPAKATRLYDEVRKRWKCPSVKARGSRVVDLAERTARGSSVMHAVPGDHVPIEATVFAGSGCTLAADLAALQAE